VLEAIHKSKNSAGAGMRCMLLRSPVSLYEILGG
jgi:hypothetical protein